MAVSARTNAPTNSRARSLAQAGKEGDVFRHRWATLGDHVCVCLRACTPELQRHLKSCRDVLNHSVTRRGRPDTPVSSSPFSPPPSARSPSPLVLGIRTRASFSGLRALTTSSIDAVDRMIGAGEVPVRNTRTSQGDCEATERAAAYGQGSTFTSRVQAQLSGHLVDTRSCGAW